MVARPAPTAVADLQFALIDPSSMQYWVMAPDPFAVPLAELMDRVAAGIGDAAVIQRDGPLWFIEPARSGASPLWVAGEGAWDLTVGFGRAGSRIELGFSNRVSARDELEALQDICLSVVAGRLVEWRKRRKHTDASRWWLTREDGSSEQGSTNWLLPVFKWTQVEKEIFTPYVG